MEYLDYDCFNMVGRNFYLETQCPVAMAPPHILSYHITQAQYVEHVGRFTYTGPLLTPNGEIAPTGRRVELQFGEFFQMKDGDRLDVCLL